MPDILHRVGVKSTSPDHVFQALATRSGLAAWWTETTAGEAVPGGVLKFRFGDRGGFDMRVLESAAPRRVLWQVIDGPDEWVGTTVSFDLAQEDDHTIVLFRHQGWNEAAEFMHHCSTKWGVFLLSLKSLIETGRGSPYPHDVKIDNWN